MARGRRPLFPFSLLSSRAGVELAINTIVVLILGIVVLIAGGVIIKNLLSEAPGIVKKLSAKQIGDLEGQLTDGQLVAVSPQAQTSYGGKWVGFGLGVRNTLSTDETFGVDIYYSPENVPSVNPNWSIQYFKTLDVAKGDRETTIINIGENARQKKTVAPGVYTFIVNVTYGSPAKVYDSVRFFTVTVK